MRRGWLSILALALLGLAGCAGSGATEDHPLLVLDHLPSPPPPPSMSIPVNVTDEDRANHPVLDQLLSEWEASAGRFAGFSEPHPYAESLELIQALQGREPGGYYRTGSVRIAYGGELFDLSAIKTHADG